MPDCLGLAVPCVSVCHYLACNILRSFPTLELYLDIVIKVYWIVMPVLVRAESALVTSIYHARHLVKTPTFLLSIHSRRTDLCSC